MTWHEAAWFLPQLSGWTCFPEAHPRSLPRGRRGAPGLQGQRGLHPGQVPLSPLYVRFQTGNQVIIRCVSQTSSARPAWASPAWRVWGAERARGPEGEPGLGRGPPPSGWRREQDPGLQGERPEGAVPRPDLETVPAIVAGKPLASGSKPY